MIDIIVLIISFLMNIVTAYGFYALGGWAGVGIYIVLSLFINVMAMKGGAK